MPSLYSTLQSPLFLALLLAISQKSAGQVSLVPEGLLNFIPEACNQALNEIVLPCAIENVCFQLLPTEAELAAIPAESEIESCADVEAGLCPITSRCEQCKALADDLFKCIIVNNGENGAISQNVADLVTSCSLDCTSVVEDPSDAPIASPTDAPLSDAPVAAETEGEVSEAPVTSPSEGSEEPPTDAPTVGSASSGLLMTSAAVATAGVMAILTMA